MRRLCLALQRGTLAGTVPIPIIIGCGTARYLGREWAAVFAYIFLPPDAQVSCCCEQWVNWTFVSAPSVLFDISLELHGHSFLPNSLLFVALFLELRPGLCTTAGGSSLHCLRQNSLLRDDPWIYYLTALLQVVKPLTLVYSTFPNLSVYCMLVLICLKSCCFLLIRYFSKTAKKKKILPFLLACRYECFFFLPLVLAVSLSPFFSVLLEHYVLSCQIASSQLKLLCWFKRNQPEAPEKVSFSQRKWMLGVLNE